MFENSVGNNNINKPSRINSAQTGICHQVSDQIRSVIFRYTESLLLWQPVCLNMTQSINVKVKCEEKKQRKMLKLMSFITTDLDPRHITRPSVTMATNKQTSKSTYALTTEMKQNQNKQIYCSKKRWKKSSKGWKQSLKLYQNKKNSLRFNKHTHIYTDLHQT